MTVGIPQVPNPPPIPRTPDRQRRIELETPGTDNNDRESRQAQLTDPDFVPPGSPRSQLELRNTRENPPLTRARMRLQTLREGRQ
jgi:hypothetical protein